jgi:hypothetical protein
MGGNPHDLWDVWEILGEPWIYGATAAGGLRIFLEQVSGSGSAQPRK